MAETCEHCGLPIEKCQFGGGNRKRPAPAVPHPEHDHASDGRPHPDCKACRDFIVGLARLGNEPLTRSIMHTLEHYYNHRPAGMGPGTALKQCTLAMLRIAKGHALRSTSPQHEPCEWLRAVCTVHGGAHYIPGTLSCDKSGAVSPHSGAPQHDAPDFDAWWARVEFGDFSTNPDAEEQCREAWNAALASHPVHHDGAK